MRKKEKVKHLKKYNKLFKEEEEEKLKE